MESTKNLTQDPRKDPVFRTNMAAAIRQYGRNGLRILKNGDQFCTGCGRILPTATIQKVRHEPVFCQNCGRLVINETDPRRPLFATAFA